MTREQALRVLTAGVKPAEQRSETRRVLRTLMYAEGSGTADGPGYRVTWTRDGGYHITIGDDQ